MTKFEKVIQQEAQKRLNSIFVLTVALELQELKHLYCTMLKDFRRSHFLKYDQVTELRCKIRSAIHELDPAWKVPGEPE